MAGLVARRWTPDGAVSRLVVLCHGVGADGSDLIDLAQSWKHDLPQTAFVAPDGPEAYDGAPYGRQWWAIGDRDRRAWPLVPRRRCHRSTGSWQTNWPGCRCRPAPQR